MVDNLQINLVSKELKMSKRVNEGEVDQ